MKITKALTKGHVLKHHQTDRECDLPGEFQVRLRQKGRKERNSDVFITRKAPGTLI